MSGKFLWVRFLIVSPIERILYRTVLYCTVLLSSFRSSDRVNLLSANHYNMFHAIALP